MKKSGKYFDRGFGRDALSLWSASNVLADRRDAVAVRAAAEVLAGMWASAVATERTDLARAAEEFAADTDTLAGGTWTGAAMVAALAAADLSRRAGDPDTAARMEAIAATICP